MESDIFKLLLHKYDINPLYTFCKVSFYIKVGKWEILFHSYHLVSDMKTCKIIFVSFLILILPFQAEFTPVPQINVSKIKYIGFQKYIFKTFRVKTKWNQRNHPVSIVQKLDF